MNASREDPDTIDWTDYEALDMAGCEYESKQFPRKINTTKGGEVTPG